MELSITLIIVIITSLVSIGAFSNQKLMNYLIFYHPSIKAGQWYRFLSCGLIHADPGHLIFNMLALYIFGAGQNKTGLEYIFIAVFGNSGKWIFLLMYILALVVSLLPTYSKNINNYHYRSLGASGAVSAVVFSMILFNPVLGVGLFFIPIYIAGFLFAIIYLLISGWLDKKGGGNINHSAHIFGAIFGVIFTVIACKIFSDYPVFTAFIDQIKNMGIKDIIRFGN